MDGTVLTDRQFRISTLYTPRIRAVPVLISCTVFGRIFKITVLNQLRIKSTIGSIIDILKENTYQMLANGLHPSGIHPDGGSDRFQSGKADGILFGTLIILYIAEFLMLSKTNQLFYIRIRYFLHITVQGIFIKDNLPGSDQSGHGRLLRIDILLGSPLQQVGRMGSTPYFSAGGKLPPAIPTSIFRFFQKRFNHSLFRPPTPEITFQIGKAVGYTQPLVAIGAPCEFQSAASLVFRMGVREDVDRIGLIIYFFHGSTDGLACCQ